MRTPFIAGNWKMNTTKATAIDLARGVVQGAPAKVDVGVAPPFVYLDAVGQAIAGSTVMLGAQDAYGRKNGAFTGEISVEMLKDLNVKFVLNGHSERRHILHDSPELVAEKADAIYAAGLILIHCVGEKPDERDAGRTLAVVETQLKELKPSIMPDPGRLVIAYEPVWAIGTGLTPTEPQVQEVHAYIRHTLGKMWNTHFSDRVRIQYGGSMNAANAAKLLALPDVDGGLIGGAAMKAESFLTIVANVKK
jgi:triosephosphate isomerase